MRMFICLMRNFTSKLSDRVVKRRAFLAYCNVALFWNTIEMYLDVFSNPILKHNRIVFSLKFALIWLPYDFFGFVVSSVEMHTETLYIHYAVFQMHMFICLMRNFTSKISDRVVKRRAFLAYCNVALFWKTIEMNSLTLFWNTIELYSPWNLL